MLSAETSSAADDAARLWSLAQGGGAIDAAEFMDAMCEAAHVEQPNYRTRLLMREGVEALAEHRGREWVEAAVESSGVASRLTEIAGERFDETGFPSLCRRIMDITRPETIRQFLRELAEHIDRPCRLDIGGATSLMLRNLLRRHTENIDVADEVPAAIRERRELLKSLSDRYGLSLTHFQSHYLPTGWERRLEYFDRFGMIDIRLVDVCDVFVGKLFSRREKDRDDLRAVAPRLEKPVIIERIHSAATAFLEDPALRDNAMRNWRIVYGEELPIDL